MERILVCLQDMAPFALAALPLYGLGRWLYIRRRKRSFQRLREIGLALLAVYGVGLASQTVMTGFQASMDGGGINLIPGKVIADGIRLGLGAGNWHYLTLNVLGNLLILLPIGFALPLLWRVTPGRAALICLGISLAIELCQLFQPRWTDVDDLILNAFGGWLGAYTSQLLLRRFPKCAAIFRAGD